NSDEWLLDRGAASGRTVFVKRSAGDIMRRLPALFSLTTPDLSEVSDGDVLPNFSVSTGRHWSAAAAELCLRARGTYRVHDGKLHFAPLHEDSITINEADA